MLDLMASEVRVAEMEREVDELEQRLAAVLARHRAEQTRDGLSAAMVAGMGHHYRRWRRSSRR